ncbi:uncharacterized protein TNCV_827211 [Trichonephila clavipes]|nr:uncharacterized protein TNCV_827211 [Trichonephila clavipes]
MKGIRLPNFKTVRLIGVNFSNGQIVACPRFEQLVECAEPCNTCHGIECEPVCIPGYVTCACIPGYTRNHQGKCIPRRECRGRADPLVAKTGSYPVRHGVELGLDDRNGLHILCYFKSKPHFISRICQRGMEDQPLNNPWSFSMSDRSGERNGQDNNLISYVSRKDATTGRNISEPYRFVFKLLWIRNRDERVEYPMASQTITSDTGLYDDIECKQSMSGLLEDLRRGCHQNTARRIRSRLKRQRIAPVSSFVVRHIRVPVSLYNTLSGEAEIMVTVLTVHAVANVIAPYERIPGMLRGRNTGLLGLGFDSDGCPNEARCTASCKKRGFTEGICADPGKFFCSCFSIISGP